MPKQKKEWSQRTTITVPADLKRRMEAVEEPVNWSAVAARAFEAKLAQLGRPAGETDTTSNEVAIAALLARALRVAAAAIENSG